MNDRRRDLGLLVLRFAGLYMALAHGLGKISMLATGNGAQFVEGVGKMGFPVPVVFAWAAALAEFAGGLLVFLGLFTLPAALFSAFNMFVAAFVAHHAFQNWLTAAGLMSVPEETVKGWGSPEMAILYLLVFVTLALTGPGAYSLDRRLRRKAA